LIVPEDARGVFAAEHEQGFGVSVVNEAVPGAGRRALAIGLHQYPASVAPLAHFEPPLLVVRFSSADRNETVSGTVHRHRHILKRATWRAGLALDAPSMGARDLNRITIEAPGGGGIEGLEIRTEGAFRALPRAQLVGGAGRSGVRRGDHVPGVSDPDRRRLVAGRVQAGDVEMLGRSADAKIGPGPATVFGGLYETE
jgi:hypothetical protein